MVPLCAEVALVPLGGGAPRRTPSLESCSVALGVGPAGAMSSGLSLALSRKLPAGTAVATTSTSPLWARPLLLHLQQDLQWQMLLLACLLVCPSAERFGLERQERKTGNPEQSRDVTQCTIADVLMGAAKKAFSF